MFPKINLLTNDSRLDLDVQIIMPRVNDLRPANTCGEDDSILRDDDGRTENYCTLGNLLKRLRDQRIADKLNNSAFLKDCRSFNARLWTQ